MTISPCTWRGLPSFQFIGPRHQIIVSEFGAHLASFRLLNDEIEPMWQPSWETADPTKVKDNDPRWGGLPAGPLLTNIAGSNLCCDRFGSPWPGENKPVHGEVCLVRFQGTLENDTLIMKGHLPIAELSVIRSFRLDKDGLELTTTIKHTGEKDRFIEWAEHTSLSGPLLDDAEVKADISRAFFSPVRDEKERFPIQPTGTNIPISDALAFPRAGTPPCGDVIGSMIEKGTSPGKWSISNKNLKRQFTCTFKRTDWPWLALWTQNKSRTAIPWLGRERVRGMELSTKPFPESKPPQERSETYEGQPTTCLIPKGTGLTKTLRLTWEKI